MFKPRSQKLVASGIIKRQTASVHLKELADLGMLTEIKVGREKLFLHPGFVHLLTSDDHPVLPCGTTAIRKHRPAANAGALPPHTRRLA